MERNCAIKKTLIVCVLTLFLQACSLSSSFGKLGGGGALSPTGSVVLGAIQVSDPTATNQAKFSIPQTGTLQVMNIGSVDLTLLDFSALGSTYVLTSGSCQRGATLSPQQSCTIGYSYTVVNQGDSAEGTFTAKFFDGINRTVNLPLSNTATRIPSGTVAGNVIIDTL